MQSRTRSDPEDMLIDQEIRKRNMMRTITRTGNVDELKEKAIHI